MIWLGIGCCLIGGGLKGMIDHAFRPMRVVTSREHAPIRY